MGSYTSKLFFHHNDDEAKLKSRTIVTCPTDLQKIKLCTPPITKRKFANDPRSATIGIVRSPIEVTATPPDLGQRIPNAIPKYLQSKRYLETDFDSIMPETPERVLLDPRSPNITGQRTPIMVKPVDQYSAPTVTANPISATDHPNKVQTAIVALDPRSPATDFDRTPILKPRFAGCPTVTAEEVLLPLSDHENGSAKLMYCETTVDYNIPEIQTIAEPLQIEESSTCDCSMNELETLRNKDSASNTTRSGEISSCSENDQQITVIHNPAAWSDTTALTRMGIEMIAANDDNDEEVNETNDSLGAALENEINEIENTATGKPIGAQNIFTSNEKVKVWRDSVSPNLGDKNKNVGEKVTIGESKVELYSATTLPKNPKIPNIITLSGRIDDDISKNHMKKKKLQQQAKTGNKPLIEERENFGNEEKIPVELSLNRTPLGNRSNNHKQRSRILAKSPQQLLRTKGLSVQQENTPPAERFAAKTRPHGIQWDADTTIII